MKYSEANIATVLKRIKQLENEHQIKPSKIFLDLQRKIGEFNEEQPKARIREVKKTTFYNRLKTPVNLTQIFDEGAFRILIELLEDRGFRIHNNPAAAITGLHFAISQFADFSEHDDNYAREMLPGYYRTFRPAIGKSGWAVAGLLHIFEDPVNGALETSEIMAYQTRNENKKLSRHTFNGMAWYSKGHYLILTTDSNTKFMQTVILRSAYVDEVEERLEGSYLTVTNKGGKNIICSKILLERLHCTPDSGKVWIKVLRDTIGYKHPDHEDPRRRIKPSIWKKIDPREPTNLVRI